MTTHSHLGVYIHISSSLERERQLSKTQKHALTPHCTPLASTSPTVVNINKQRPALNTLCSFTWACTVPFNFQLYNVASLRKFTRACFINYNEKVDSSTVPEERKNTECKNDYFWYYDDCLPLKFFSY